MSIYRKPGEVIEDEMKKKDDGIELLVSANEKASSNLFTEAYNIGGICSFVLMAIFVSVAAGGYNILPMMVVAFFSFIATVFCMIRRAYWKKISAIGVVAGK
jgi:predicted signal transduction protein with EAL and GGDEF domain